MTEPFDVVIGHNPTVWVALCVVVGIALGHVMPGVFQMVGAAEIAKVNRPVGVLADGHGGCGCEPAKRPQPVKTSCRGRVA